MLRPEVAQERLEPHPDGLVRITLKKAYTDGTVAVDMDPPASWPRWASRPRCPAARRVAVRRTGKAACSAAKCSVTKTTVRVAGCRRPRSDGRDRGTGHGAAEACAFEPDRGHRLLPRRSSEPVQGPPGLVTARNEPPRGGLLPSGPASYCLRADWQPERPRRARSLVIWSVAASETAHLTGPPALEPASVCPGSRSADYRCIRLPPRVTSERSPSFAKLRGLDARERSFPRTRIARLRPATARNRPPSAVQPRTSAPSTSSR